MIYLKSFNESKEDLILDELKDLIEGRLVHLLYDNEGFDYFIHKINKLFLYLKSIFIIIQVSFF